MILSALVLYLLHVSGDPRVQEQAQPGLVELLGGLHGDEDVFCAEVLGRRRVGGGRRGASGLLRLPASPGQLGEVRRESQLDLRAPGLCGVLQRRGRAGVRVLVPLSPVMLHGDQKQQQAETRRAGYGDSCLLSIVFQHDSTLKDKKKKT